MAGRQDNPSLNDVVTLNVGGEKFETTRQTLMNDPSSMLAKMFDPISPLQPGEQGYITRKEGLYLIFNISRSPP